jgi:EAL domain-containing protein (putative c-di-GMP-specific phosphodiesterase class I)/GGDEF domain-containing protein
VLDNGERLDVVFGHLREGVLVEDETRHVKFANKAFTDIFIPGLDPALLVGGDCDATAVETAPMFKNAQEWLDVTREIVASKQPISNDKWETVDGRWLQRDYRPRLSGDVVFEHIWLYRDVTPIYADRTVFGVDAASSERVGFRDWSAAIERFGKRANSVGALDQGAMACVKVRQLDVLNVEFGYEGSDALLVSVLEELREEFGQANVERLKGIVFGVLTTDADAHELMNRIHLLLDPTRAVGDQFVYLNTVIGVATTSTIEDFIDGQEMFECARQAVREAGHRNADVVLDAEMRNRRSLQNELRTRINEALVAGEFKLHFQPIVRLADGEVLGYEALVRWHHPESGLLTAGEFIIAAEEAGVIAKIDRWVIHEACREASALLKNPDRYVAVNLSPMSSDRGDDVLEVLRNSMAKFNVDPKQINIEITETAIARDQLVFVRLLTQIRAMGVKVTIDDFGMGASTLAILKDIPFDRLKLDGAFTRDIEEPRVQEIIRVAQVIGEILGGQVIAEGVETQAQSDLLQECGVTIGQGWHLGMPEPL